MNIKTKSDYFITLAEAKIHLRVDSSFTTEDDYISQLIKAATNMAESYINKDIAQTSNTLTIDEFSGDEITINEGNYRSVTSVNGSSSGYSVVYNESDFVITLDSSVSDTDMTIIFETGYILATYPAQIRQAVLIKLADLYDTNRSSFHLNAIKMNQIFETLLNYFTNKNWVKDDTGLNG